MYTGKIYTELLTDGNFYLTWKVCLKITLFLEWLLIVRNVARKKMLVEIPREDITGNIYMWPGLKTGGDKMLKQCMYFKVPTLNLLLANCRDINNDWTLLSARNVFILNKIEHCLEWVIAGNVLRVVRKKRFVEGSA